MSGVWGTLYHFMNQFRLPENGNRIQRYGFVLVIIFIFFLIKTAIVAFLGTDIPFLLSLFIVILCAWFGGFGPGILATLLTAGLTDYFFLEPKNTFLGQNNTANIAILLIYLTEGIFISVLSEAIRRSEIKKSEFIGVISHEIKNPLTSVKGYAGLIQKIASEKGETQIAEFARRVDQQINNVSEMVNEMLDITKIATGRLTFHDEPFAIDSLVREIIDDRQVTTQNHIIHLSGKSGVILTGDRYRIGQVITNLISNAIKYSPESKKILVKIESKKKSVLVSVQDFGQGIAKKDQSKVFQPYFRAKNSSSAKGTGIGLYISSQIVARYKGKLWVKSTFGKGATFYMQLSTITE